MLIRCHSLSQSGTSSQIKTSSQSGSSSPSKTSSSTRTSSQSTTSSQSVSSVSACAVTAFNVEVNGCTKHAATVTATSYTDCGGCTMTTDYLPGPAMVCDLVSSFQGFFITLKADRRQDVYEDDYCYRYHHYHSTDVRADANLYQNGPSDFCICFICNVHQLRFYSHADCDHRLWWLPWLCRRDRGYGPWTGE